MNQISKKTLVLAVLLLSLQYSWAQFTARGNVTSEEGEPLIGATVLVKGTVSGTVTDLDGNFLLDVPTSEATLVISFTGYETREVDVSTDSPNVDLQLEFLSSRLNEIVVVGYGSTRREALTGSVATLRAESIEQVPLGSIEQTLQGNIAGLQSMMGNGQPGANVSVRIRGQGSISASSEPLYVIDGIPLASGNLTEAAETSNPLATINPNDIANVTVLKDAASTAIYGSRGANGVILITTKSGRAGKPKLDLRTQVGFNSWAVGDDVRLRGLTAEEYTNLYIEGWVNTGETVEEAIVRFNNQFPDPVSGQPAVDITPDGSGGWRLGTVRVDNRWIDELSRTGLNQSYDLSISGGTEAITYFASGSYFQQEAPIIYSQMDRYSSRLNLAVEASERLRFTNNLSVSRTGQQGMNDATRWANPLYNGYLLAPVIPARDAEGQFYDGHKNFFMGGNNPIGSLSGDDTQEWTMTRILDNISGAFEIADGLTIKSAWSIDLLNYQEFYFRNARYGDGRNTGGFGQEVTKNTTNWIGTQTLDYAKSMGSSNFDALLGYETQKSSLRAIEASAQEFPNPQVRTLANAASPQETISTLDEFAFTSLFGRVGYNYDFKYYLSASLRRDGSSRFGLDNRFGTFWSVGASWRLSEEPFLSTSTTFNDLKLRVSYGVTGNAGIANYEHLALFGFTDASDNSLAYDGAPGGAPTQIGNRSLTWEQSKSFNVGLDFNIKDRVDGTIEYFDRESDNLLQNVPISRTTGFTELPQNIGAMSNKGLELTLNINAIQGSNFNWSVGGNLTFLNNRITRLNEEFIDGTKIRREGEDFQSYYLFLWAGVNPDDGSPLFYTDETETATTSNVNEIEQEFVGKSATPDMFGGFNTQLSLGNLSLNANFVMSFGNWIYDATAWVLQGDGRFTPRSQTHLVLDRWQQPGDITDVPKFSWGNRSNSNLRPSTRWLYDGSHVRLRNLTLAYTLPQSVISRANLRNLRIYVRGINLLTWTKDSDLYLDPETPFSGVVNSPVPNLRTISFGVDIGL